MLYAERILKTDLNNEDALLTAAEAYLQGGPADKGKNRKEEARHHRFCPVALAAGIPVVCTAHTKAVCFACRNGPE